MSQFDNVDAIPRRTMTLFFVVDTSGSMAGEKIASVNTAVNEVIPYIEDISSSNADAQIKIAALEFSSGTEWMFSSPVESENFKWRDLEAGGLTSLGEACKELDSKLSKTNGFMAEATGSFAPAIILMSDGEPTDDYKHYLDKLKGNSWFKAAIKVAIAIGDQANNNILAEFTGNSEAVLTVHNKEQLKKIIRFVSVTASQVASSHASVGKDAPETKQEEFTEKIADTLANDSELQGVDSGTDVTPGADCWGDWQ
jgi:uncharacterized protein YegL